MGCPDDTTFTYFISGSLDADRAGQVAAHLDACSPCRQLVQALLHRSSISHVAHAATQSQPAPGAIEDGGAVLPAGFTFNGRYRVSRCIGAGGMGSVYAVVHTETQGRYALKVMASRLVHDPEMRRRFLYEAQIAAKVESDHIARVFDAGIDDATGMPFIAMELLSGEDVASWIRRMGRLTPEATVTLLGQAALALDKTHAAGIVHRDLKPHNLFITQRDDKTPCLKILDFGIAKLIDTTGSSARTRSAGTPVYMPPEQIRGDGDIGPDADGYALAHIAYNMLTGRAYWETEATELGLSPFIQRVLHGPPEVPSARAARAGVSLSPGFDDWFARAASPSRELRIVPASESVRALAHALGVPSAAGATTPASVSAVGAPPRAPVSPGAQTTGALVSDAAAPDRPSRSWAWLVALFALVALSAGVYLGIYFSYPDGSQVEKNSKTKKKKPAASSVAKNETKGRAAPPLPCPLERCVNHTIDRGAPIEAADHLARATELAVSVEPKSELVMILVKNIVDGRGPTGGKLSLSYMYRYTLPTDRPGKLEGLVVLANGNQLQAQRTKIPGMAEVGAPECNMQRAFRAAVGAGLSTTAPTTLLYSRLSGAPAWKVSQNGKADEVYVSGATCVVADVPKRKKK